MQQSRCGLAGTSQEHTADTEKTFLLPLLASAWHRVLSMFTSVQRGTPLSPPSFLLEPQIHLWFAVSVLWLRPLRAWHGVSLLEGPDAAPACLLAHRSSPLLRSKLTFRNTRFLSKPKSLGESTVCHCSLPDQWCPQSEWLFQQKLAGSWHP